MPRQVHPFALVGQFLWLFRIWLHPKKQTDKKNVHDT